MPARSEEQRALTSLRIFRKFIKIQGSSSDGSQNQPNASYELDATGIISKDCYDMWLTTRKTRPPNPERAFQRALGAHLGALDGRTPFEPEEEQAILRAIRSQSRWPCFESSERRYGMMKYRTKGYHERMAERRGDDRQVKGRTNSARKNNSSRNVPKEEHDSNEDIDDDDEDDNFGETRSSGAQYSLEVAPRGRPLLAQSHKRLRLSDPSVPLNSMTVASPPSEMRPEPPSGVDTLDFHIQDPFVSYFWQLGRAALSSLYYAGVDVWDRVLSIRRMILISRGQFAEPNEELVRQVFEDECIKHSDACIVVIDPIARSPRDRIMFMNAKSEEIMGKLSRADGGCHRAVFPPSEYWTVLKLSVRVWARLNEDVFTHLRFYDKNMSSRMAQVTIRAIREHPSVFVYARFIE